jgi:DNA-directed RNA polymerase specialized sigma24 family protein
VLDDLSYESVAEVLDCPVGTAKSLISRALTTIRGAADELSASQDRGVGHVR